MDDQPQLVPQSIGTAKAPLLGPFAIVAASLIGALAWVVWSIRSDAERFRGEFIHQNLSELAAGDTLALSRRLEALSTTISWNCIRGSRSGEPFYVRELGPCGDGLFRRQVGLSLPERPDISVTVTVTARRDVVALGFFLASGQLVLLGLLARSVRTTERVKLASTLTAERTAARLNEAIARASQMLAHDLKKPFTIMRLAWDQLERRMGATSLTNAVAELAPNIRRAIDSGLVITADLLVAGGDLTLNLQPEGLRELCTRAAEIATESAAHPSASQRRKVEIDVPPDVTVVVDGDKIERLLVNLLVNALQATTDQDRVWIDLMPPKDRPSGAARMTLAVRNTGSTIAPADLPHLFDPFFTKGKRGGTGLGLAIVRRIAEAHGGGVYCTSDTDDGVAFFVALATAPQADAEHAGVSLPPRSEPNKALIAPSPAVAQTRAMIALVEDNLVVQMTWSWAFESVEGTELRLYDHPLLLVADIKSNPALTPSLMCVVTDLNFDECDPSLLRKAAEFPDSLSDGVALGRWLKEHCPSVPVILATDSKASAASAEVFAATIDKVNVTYDRIASIVAGTTKPARA